MATKARTKSAAKKKPASKAPANKKPANKKPAKKKPAKRKAAAKPAGPARKPVAATKAAAELRQVENLIEAELDRPEAKPRSASAIPSVSAAPDTILSRAGGGVPKADITAFLRQLIMMLDAGTPILKSLKALSRRGERKALRDMVGGIAEYVESGNPLWQAFAREGKHFPPVDVNLIKASEASGTLTAVLRRIADYREKKARLDKHIQVAMIYPAFLLSASVALVIILSAYVLPAFKDVFDTMADAEIGGFSLLVMDMADWVSSYWWLPVAILIGLIAIYKLYWVKDPLRRLQSDKLKLKIPIWGHIIQRGVIADFTRTLSMLLRSGISMMPTLDLCKSAVSNHTYIGVIQDLRDSVESGEGLEAPLRQAERDGHMPGIVVDMLVTGEESGSLEKVADQIADIYEEEVEIAVNGIKEAITPIFVVGMGAVVGCMVLAMFLPLISMIESISGGAL